MALSRDTSDTKRSLGPEEDAACEGRRAESLEDAIPSATQPRCDPSATNDEIVADAVAGPFRGSGPTTPRERYPALADSSAPEGLDNPAAYPFSPAAVAAAYDTVAEDYAIAFGDDLERLSVDRFILDAAAARIRRGLAIDVGSGPGQVSRYLADRGLAVVALDLAPGMLTLGGQDRRAGGVCADMRRVPLRSGSCAGAIAFYSLQHLPRHELPVVLTELRRVLRPGGVLAIATHLGDGEVCLTEFLGHRISPLGGTLHNELDIEQELVRHSFAIVERRRRDPRPNEYPSQRLYVLAERRITAS